MSMGISAERLGFIYKLSLVNLTVLVISSGRLSARLLMLCSKFIRLWTLLARLLDVVDEQTFTVLLFALHGMGPNESQAHLMPSMLDAINTNFKPQGRARQR